MLEVEMMYIVLTLSKKNRFHNKFITKLHRRKRWHVVVEVGDWALPF